MKISSTKKILIVDDDYSTRILLEKIIRENITNEVYQADEGSIALRMMSREKPDLVVLDMGMPFMNGFEVLKTMQKYSELEKIKVIACTSLSDQESVRKILSYGVSDFILKPVNKKILIEKISHKLKEISKNEENQK